MKTNVDLFRAFKSTNNGKKQTSLTMSGSLFHLSEFSNGVYQNSNFPKFNINTYSEDS